MSDPELVRGLESRLINAWPSFDYQTYDGWMVRFAGGYSKRANSATPLVQGATLDDALVDHVIEQFLRANIRPTFRLNGLEAPGCRRAAQGARTSRDRADPRDGRADRRGLPCRRRREAAGAAVTRLGARGVAFLRGRQVGRRDADANRLAHPPESRVRDTPSSTTGRSPGGSASPNAVMWGSTTSWWRRICAASASAAGWSAASSHGAVAKGAHSAYLQVRAENEIAGSLYSALGFDVAYDYTHRVMPGGA